MRVVRSVRRTAEFARIERLPRRTFTKRDAVAAAKKWSRVLVRRKGVHLLPWQGGAIETVVRSFALSIKNFGRGAVLSLPVGQGKTYICEAIPLVLDITSSVLILPASLKDKTYDARRKLISDFKLAKPPPRIITQEELAIEANAGLLDYLQPGLILIDESHKNGNFDASATQRIHRYKTKNPRTVVVSMTGTLSRKTIMTYHHHLLWAFGPEGAPVPATRSEAATWAAAIDESMSKQSFRPNAGPLGDDVDSARQWYRKRLDQTEGVLLVDEDSAAHIPLTVRVEYAYPCKKIDKALKKLATDWESPSGEPITDALSVDRLYGQIGVGLCTYYDPPPPKKWALARREFAAFVRKRIKDTRRSAEPLDTEAQVKRRHRHNEKVTAWLDVKDDYDMKAHEKVKWVSDATLRYCVDWLTRSKEPSILWYGSVPFSKALAKATGLPHYGRKGREVNTGRQLFDADPKSSMIVSWHANQQGFDLQAWRRNGIIYIPTSALALEQVMGRPHRTGQRDPVEFTWIATSGHSLDALAGVYSQAIFTRDTSKHTQKILRAKLVIPDPPSGMRWLTKEDKE